MQNEAMGSPSFPNSYPRGVRIGALCRQLSQDQALCQNCRAEDCMRNEAESTSGICHLLVFAFLPPYGLPFLPSFSIPLRGEKKKNPHKETSITDFKKQDTVKTIRNDS